MQFWPHDAGFAPSNTALPSYRVLLCSYGLYSYDLYIFMAYLFTAYLALTAYEVMATLRGVRPLEHRVLLVPSLVI